MALIAPKDAVSKKVLLKQYDPTENAFERFESALKDFKSKIDNNGRENFNETWIRDFLNKAFYQTTNAINKKDNIDYAIFSDTKAKENVLAIIEAKRVNSAEFPSIDGNINVKALHETVLYFMRESIIEKNKNVRSIIITNANEWFIFDAREFELSFALNKDFENMFRYCEKEKKTEDFYGYVEKSMGKTIDKLNYVYFNIQRLNDDELLDVFKILSPYYLLGKPCATDSNTLNKEFYNELLYIIGLCETTDSDNKIIIDRLKESKRERGSLIENTITQLSYISSDNLFKKAIQLVIVWINRILFLKLLEAQLVKWHDGDETYKFLTPEKLKEFDTLKKLFFGVLARQPYQRDAELTKDFQNIPYLNSSLFEPTEELSIAELADDVLITVYNDTVLTAEKGKKMKPLEYLLKFLDAYDFGSVKSEKGLRKESKTLINASVLGLIFEKINGYKEGSFFTPGTITQYMCKEAISRAVVQKFNDIKGWKCKTLVDVHNNCHEYNVNIDEKNQIINSVRICDPAVGSGHFLVSALNELISIKHQLHALRASDGTMLTGNLNVENDELFVTYANGDEFTYNSKLDESQKIQETLFNEKRTIIENCLFGVDINPNSVNICRLRLWIELLKNAYYRPDPDPKLNGALTLETLPNIDINIKCGNSLLSKYPVKIGQSIVNDDIKNDIAAYKKAVADYKKETSNKQAKREVENRIATIKTRLTSGVQLNLFDDSIRERVAAESIYRNAMEWMIEFPEVLDKDGNFLGFDVVIGNPPYLSSKKVTEDDKKMYLQKYGFKDDLYNYFTFRGLQLARINGTLNYIIPKTFWTIQTKRNMRDLILGKNVKYIFDAGNPFEDAMVDTCIIQIENTNYTEENIISFFDGSKDLKAPITLAPIKQSVYLDTHNAVIFKPTDRNLKVWHLYNEKVKELCNTWWERIKTSEKIKQNEYALEQYRASLKPGDITLLGCLTDGGQGLGTADNSKYLAVRSNTKKAASIQAGRPQKLADAMKKNPAIAKELENTNANEYLAGLSEMQIALKFDELKEKYGRNIFGSGYIFKIVDDGELAEVETLTDDEKTNGISSNKKYYVPYDKGDKDGNRWYFESPYVIAWTKENVDFLKNDPNARYQGAAFYFKEGLCWTLLLNENSKYFKVRIKGKTINDVNAMAIYPFEDCPEYTQYIICLLNSYTLFHHKRNFVSSNAAFQINDARQLPIIIPTSEQLLKFKALFDNAVAIKKQQFSAAITVDAANEILEQIQTELDKLVDELYGL